MCFTGVASSRQSVAHVFHRYGMRSAVRCPVFHRCGKRSAVSCPMYFTGVASGRQSVALCISQVWQAVRSQFEKPEIKRVYESRGGEELLKDMSAVHQYPHAGFGLIKIHLAESDAR